jgi:hypothetical protein
MKIEFSESCLPAGRAGKSNQWIYSKSFSGLDFFVTFCIPACSRQEDKSMNKF